MCSVSMVGDDWTKKWSDNWPHQPQGVPYPLPYKPWAPTSPFPTPDTPKPLKPIDVTEYIAPVDRKEFDALKKLVEQMKAELEAAKAQDIANNEPDCEQEDKVALLKAIAKAFGVDLSTIWPEESK